MSSTPIRPIISTLPYQLPLKESADPDKETRSGDLGTAIEQGDLNLVDLFLKAGANPNAEVHCDSALSTPLRIAIRRGNTRLVELLLSAGASPNAIHYSNDTNTYRTPLDLAIQSIGITKNAIQIVDLLLRYGADANQKSRFGVDFFTPLTRVMDRGVSENRLQCIRLLLLAGADPFKSVTNIDMNNFSPVQLAIDMDDIALLGLLFAGAKKLPKSMFRN